MNKLAAIALLLFLSFTTMAQENDLPLKEIPPYPESYSPGNVMARMVEGLGYRYYWATEGLTEKDLNYKPEGEATRTSQETLDHILGLSNTLVNATKKQPNIRSGKDEKLTFEETRARTLQNLKEASEILRNCTEKDFDEFLVVFQKGDNKSEFPFWNMINGPVADAIYHVGQVVTFRRSSGNPMPKGVSVFMGKTKE